MTKKAITFEPSASPFAQPDHFIQLRETLRVSAAIEREKALRERLRRPTFSERDLLDGLWTFLIVFTGAMLFLM